MRQHCHYFLHKYEHEPRFKTVLFSVKYTLNFVPKSVWDRLKCKLEGVKLFHKLSFVDTTGLVFPV